MRWIYSIRPKYKAAFILGIVFVLVLGKNIISERNITQLGDTFASVYEDRLLVESYIYKISDLLYRKKTITDRSADVADFERQKPQLQNYAIEIESLLTAYGKTQLTQKEALAFTQLKKEIRTFIHAENQVTNNSQNSLQLARPLLEQSFNAANKHLGQLSQIQVSEGKVLNEASQKSIAGYTLLTHVEMALLVLLGLLIQTLIFASGSAIVLSKTPGRHSLN